MSIVTDFKLDDFLPYQLAELSRRVSARFSCHYRERYGISVAEWRVVAHLSQHDQVSVREITERVGMDKPKVSRAASRLEERGFISKHVNGDDRRLVSLALTQQGREMIDTLAPIAATYQAELLAILGAEAEVFSGNVKALSAKLDGTDALRRAQRPDGA